MNCGYCNGCFKVKPVRLYGKTFISSWSFEWKDCARFREKPSSWNRRYHWRKPRATWNRLPDEIKKRRPIPNRIAKFFQRQKQGVYYNFFLRGCQPERPASLFLRTELFESLFINNRYLVGKCSAGFAIREAEQRSIRAIKHEINQSNFAKRIRVICQGNKPFFFINQSLLFGLKSSDIRNATPKIFCRNKLIL